MTVDASSQPRAATAVDALADSYLSAAATLDPLMATNIGLKGYDDRLPDLSPDGLQAVDDLNRRTEADLDRVSPVDDNDKVTIAALRERLSVAIEVHASGAPLSELNIIASPVQSLRDAFDLMATDTPEDWGVVATRLAAMPAALDGYLTSLRLAAERGDVSPRRQVAACISQCDANLGADGFFTGFVGSAKAGTEELPDSLRADLDRGAHAAQAGYQKLRDYLADELLAQAPDRDAIGRDRYAPFSRQFVGATVDLDEAYAWGQAELARITGLMRDTADEIKSGASVAEAIEILDADPGRRLAGTDALQAWMQEQADAAVTALADTHFDIPEPVRRLECKIAPTNTGVIYYTGPSEDFSRPGRMWWSVPEGVTEFSTWRELTTVYHEGVPGHHLQIAQTVYRRELLNNWRRLASWTSGHGEGWALYAEWLMADLGFMDDPGNRLGLLDGQSLRAARVVIDIGVHCGFEAPAEVGGGPWTYEKAWQLLDSHANMGEAFLRYELDRYLGWPGQAPSYKLGERLWLQIRDESRARAGDSFDLKAFHRRALDIGSVGLDVLRAAVLNEL
ncbi:MAG: DUF885 domain-containing protein [Actinomycetota bacterium]|nr:DUF885 domain-containing protein [Actinomycetota bacterium]MDQ2955962.1 DUF885 domain-containing protein [Actinomycetota bacterium]